MKDHIDKAGIRCAVSVMAMLVFCFVIWGPVNTIWIGPWIYEGTTIGSLEWRKAWVFNGWILFAPIATCLGYCIFTMVRAVRKDESERVERMALIAEAAEQRT